MCNSYWYVARQCLPEEGDPIALDDTQACRRVRGRALAVPPENEYLICGCALLVDAGERRVLSDTDALNGTNSFRHLNPALTSPERLDDTVVWRCAWQIAYRHALASCLGRMPPELTACC